MKNYLSLSLIVLSVTLNGMSANNNNSNNNNFVSSTSGTSPVLKTLSPEELDRIKCVISGKLREVQMGSPNAVTKTDCFDEAMKEEFTRSVSALENEEHKELMSKFIGANDKAKEIFFKNLENSSGRESIRGFARECEEHDWVIINHILALCGYSLISPHKGDEQDTAYQRYLSNVQRLAWKRQRFIKQFGAMSSEVQKCIIGYGVTKNAFGNTRSDLEGLREDEKKPLEEIFTYLGYTITLPSF